MKDSKILIVDDEECMISVLRRVLSKKGFKNENIVSVESGEDAIDVVQKNNFDIVLMDIKMPGMGGLEAICKIRALERDLPIIAVTGLGFSKDIKACLEAGATDCLVKPVFNDVLIQSIKAGIFANKNKPVKQFFEKEFTIL